MRVLNFFTFVFLVITTFDSFSLEISVNTLEILHYDYIEVTIKGLHDSNLCKEIYVSLFKDGGVVPDLLGRDKIFGRKVKDEIKIIYIPNYGIRDGVYELSVFSNNTSLLSTNVIFLSRQQVKLTEPLKVLTFEENIPIGKALGLNRGDDYNKAANVIYNLMTNAGLNTFMILGGQTTYLKSKSQIWYSVPISNLNVLMYLRKKGIQTGAYVMCFLTLGQNEKNKFRGYYPNLVLKNGSLKKDYKYTSILSSTRISNIVEILEYIGSKSYIDFIGLDFIRVGDYGGYELLEEFSREILSKIDIDFEISNGNIVDAIKKNKSLSKLFKWYQSVRVSRVIKHIVSRLRSKGIVKPVVAFMLGWNAGREHGQDLFMFRDAGIDYAFYMLYEFYNESMFEEAGNYYLRFVYNLDTQIVFGNIIDSKLNKGKNSLETFSNRLKTFVTHYSYFPPNGFFFHDLYRLKFGRIKPYKTEDWISKINETSKFLSQFLNRYYEK